jgi:hypothetical protein
MESESGGNLAIPPDCLPKLAEAISRRSGHHLNYQNAHAAGKLHSTAISRYAVDSRQQRLVQNIRDYGFWQAPD